MTLAPLVPDGDSDLASWQAGTQDFYLTAATDEVRKYCGWHIAPSLTVTDQRHRIGSKGYVMLRSTYVTGVDSVTLDGQTLVADTDYFWDEPKPWIRLRPGLYPRVPFVLTTFEHGYAECPSDVKAVIFEVMTTAMELPASNASRVQTMQYSFQLNPDIGIALSDNQKRRLGNYKVQNFGAPQP